MTETEHSSLRTGRLYRHQPKRGNGKIKASQDYWAELSGHFSKQSEMVYWLDAITVPASGLWLYGRIPKTGTNTVLAALHYLEFGTLITTRVKKLTDVIEDAAPYSLDNAGIFMSLLQTVHEPKILSQAFRFTLLREPTERSLSSFRYICKSHQLGTMQFASLRLRMSALVGFDWEKDIYTITGYEKMLDFLEAMSDVQRIPMDPHIAPQTANMNPAILQPNLVGRTEEMSVFLQALAARFDRKLPNSIVDMQLNSNPEKEAISIPKDVMKKTEKIFEHDYVWYESLG